MEIELQSARYQHDAIRLDMDSERGSGSGSETELDEDGENDEEEEEQGGEGNEDEDEDEDITIDEDDNKTIPDDDGVADKGSARKTILKARETKVGLWKGYLRLSKVSFRILALFLFRFLFLFPLHELAVIIICRLDS